MKVEDRSRQWGLLCPDADSALRAVAGGFGSEYHFPFQSGVSKTLRIPEPPFSLTFTLVKRGRFWRGGSDLVVQVKSHSQNLELSSILPTPVLLDSLKDTVDELLVKANLPRKLLS